MSQEKIKNEIDAAVFDFYETFGIEFEPTEMIFTGQYYGFLGWKEFFVRFGYKGKYFTKVFAKDLQSAKINLTENQKKTLFSIERIN